MIKQKKPKVKVPHNCNDYIVSGEKFIRDFEKMYENIDDPWNQNANGISKEFNILALLLQEENQKRTQQKELSVLDVGCANGYHMERFLGDLSCSKYVGTDISKTIIRKANEQNKSMVANYDVSFIVDDISKKNNNFVNAFDIIFSSKTLYYCAPEIDDVIENCCNYLVENGIFAFIYNQTNDSFSNQWLTYDLLTQKLLMRGFSMIDLVVYKCRSNENICIGIFQMNNSTLKITYDKKQS